MALLNNQFPFNNKDENNMIKWILIQSDEKEDD